MPSSSSRSFPATPPPEVRSTLLLAAQLPVPNAAEVARMETLSRERFGLELSHEEAYDALSRITHFIYLIDYEPVRPLRPQEPGG